MKKLYYCLDCKRVFNTSENCIYCKSTKIKELTKSAPINVIGTKWKGKVLSINEKVVKVILKDEYKNKFVKEYEFNKIKKVL